MVHVWQLFQLVAWFYLSMNSLELSYGTKAFIHGNGWRSKFIWIKDKVISNSEKHDITSCFYVHVHFEIIRIFIRIMLKLHTFIKMPEQILWCLSRESNSSLANLFWLSFFWSFLKNDFSLTLIAWTEACITFSIHIVDDVVSQSHGDFVNLLVVIIVKNERKFWFQIFIAICHISFILEIYNT